jgi:transmembrane sensor
MTEHRLFFLLEKYRNGTLLTDEKMELDDWYARLHFNSTSKAPDVEEMFRQFTELRKGKPARSAVRTMVKVAAAAVLIGVMFGIGMMMLESRKEQPATSITDNLSPKSEIPPGESRALLILDNGSQVELDASAQGVLAKEGSVQVVKTKDGAIEYRAAETGVTEVRYNTVRTPRGGEYMLTLHDGTKVWLNASSSIRFPTRFAEERIVDMEGEAYFEVAKDKRRPFVVRSGAQDVRVLGTHFNINAFADEGPQKVTLIEGSVEVNETGKHILLRPGEQSFMSGDNFRIEHPDIEQVMAWKSGFFELDNTSLEQTMLKISRWYDVDVVYNGTKYPDAILGGRISRKLPLSKVLTILEAYGVRASITGRKIIIGNK